MRKNKKRIRELLIYSLIITVYLAYGSSLKVSAATENCSNSISTMNDRYAEINRLIAEVDEEKLLEDAMNEVVDGQVPLTLNREMVTNLEFIPYNNSTKMEFDVHQTVQKVGDITKGGGEQASLYVAATVATDTTLEKGFNQKHGITAHIFVYWIDNWGTNNELYSISVWWDLGDDSVSNRSVEYGVMDALGVSFTNSEKVTIYVDDYQKDVSGQYFGYVVGCTSSIVVTGKGTVKCTVHSTFL